MERQVADDIINKHQLIDGNTSREILRAIVEDTPIDENLVKQISDMTDHAHSGN